MTNVERDIQLIRDLLEWSDLKAAQVAAKIGVANTTINRFANGSATSGLARETMNKLKGAFPRFPGFETGEPLENAKEDYVAVNVTPSYAGMGGGGSGEGDRQVALVSRKLIEDELGGRPSDFEMIDVRGDSMQDDFYHGDRILIDLRDRDPIQPGPFALWDDDGYVVKLVERVPRKRGWYRVFSANARYADYEVEEQEATIKGRAVWFARRL